MTIDPQNPSSRGRAQRAKHRAAQTGEPLSVAKRRLAATVMPARPTSSQLDTEFGGHEFEYDSTSDLFKCVWCQRFEHVLRTEDGRIPVCPAAPDRLADPAATDVVTAVERLSGRLRRIPLTQATEGARRPEMVQEGLLNLTRAVHAARVSAAEGDLHDAAETLAGLPLEVRRALSGAGPNWKYRIGELLPVAQRAIGVTAAAAAGGCLLGYGRSRCATGLDRVIITVHDAYGRHSLDQACQAHAEAETRQWDYDITELTVIGHEPLATTIRQAVQAASRRPTSSTEDDVNHICGHHTRHRCDACQSCTACDGCYCAEG